MDFNQNNPDEIVENFGNPDICIIGSGAAGAILAAELSENKCAICSAPKYYEARNDPNAEEEIKNRAANDYETHKNNPKYDHDFKQREGTKELTVFLFEKGSWFTKNDFTQKEDEMIPKLFKNSAVQTT